MPPFLSPPPLALVHSPTSIILSVFVFPAPSKNIYFLFPVFLPSFFASVLGRLQDEYNLFVEALLAYKDIEVGAAGYSSLCAVVVTAAFCCLTTVAVAVALLLRVRVQASLCTGFAAGGNSRPTR